MKYFFGESINAIQTQIALIANLLLTVVGKHVKYNWSFSNLGDNDTSNTNVLYIPITVLQKPRKKAWVEIVSTQNLSTPIPTLFD